MNIIFILIILVLNTVKILLIFEVSLLHFQRMLKLLLMRFNILKSSRQNLRLEFMKGHSSLQYPRRVFDNITVFSGMKTKVES